MILLAVLPAVVSAWFLVDAYQRGALSVDFEHFLVPAGRAVSHGDSPYPTFGYPPLIAFAVVPFTLVPAANVIFTAILVLCVPASLWLLGVRDWRCYGVVFAWAPVLAALQTGNVTILLLFGSAICWHFRESWRTAAVSGGLTAAAKLLSWPLVVWLAATRRLARAVGAVIVAVGVSLALFTILGPSSAADFPDRVQAGGRIDSPKSYTLKALLLDLGVTDRPATLAWGALAVAILAGVVYFGWRGDDRRSFALCVTAILFGSPIVWLHSFAFLLGTVAVLRPRLGVAWFLPILIVIGPGTGNGSTWQTAGVLAVAVVTVGLALLPSRAQAEPAAPDTRPAMSSSELASDSSSA